MPTIYECLSKYCLARNIPVPRKFYRCQIGHWINDRWKFGAYGQSLTHQQQREDNETYQVLCYPSFFEPVIMHIIDDFFISQRCGKVSGTPPKPFQEGRKTHPEPLRNPSRRVAKPIRNPFGTLPGGSQNPSGTLPEPFQEGYIPLTEGISEGPGTLCQPLSIPSEFLTEAIDKGFVCLPDPIRNISESLSESFHQGSAPLSDILEKGKACLRDPLDPPTAPQASAGQKSVAKRLRKRIYRY
jgi:hypothetical protein